MIFKKLKKTIISIHLNWLIILLNQILKGTNAIFIKKINSNIKLFLEKKTKKTKIRDSLSCITNIINWFSLE